MFCTFISMSSSSASSIWDAILFMDAESYMFNAQSAVPPAVYWVQKAMCLSVPPVVIIISMWPAVMGSAG